jgi:6-phosphogluconolactonase
VSAFAVDAQTSKLSLLNQQPSEGISPCHLATDPSGKVVAVANYSSGTFTVLLIAKDGSLKAPSCTIQDHGKGPNAARQDGPHAHWINFDPTGQFVLGIDLGTDKLNLFRLDLAKGTLVDQRATPVTPGTGPRHIAFHPNGRYAYLITELASTMVTYSWDAQQGVLNELQTLPMLPSDFKGQNTAAEVVVHPSGQFLYGSNRGHDSIAMFSIDPATCKLTMLGRISTQGKHPRNITIDPTGQWLLVANMHSDNLVVFRIDQTTGKLDLTQTAEAPSPMCMRFIPGR